MLPAQWTIQLNQATTMPACAVSNGQLEIAWVIFTQCVLYRSVIVVLHRSSDEIKTHPSAHNTLGICLYPVVTVGQEEEEEEE